MGLHDVLKLYKHGYSKVTDHASREIRFGRISREEGLSLVLNHEQAPLSYLDQFCKWLGIDIRSMQFIINEHRNKRFWSETSPGKWEFHGWSSTQRIKNEISNLESDAKFTATNSLEYLGSSNYVTIGKGYP
jgi:hypothetical protein